LKNVIGSLVLLAVMAAFSVGYKPAFARKFAISGNDATRAPVIAELFTSEGCSSCPPADALLSKLDEQQPLAGVQIIALEEHVDYWNEGGWKDPFSGEQFTERQRNYAASLSDHGVYTPEMVVNGRASLVGSRGQEALRSIANAATQPHAEISIVSLRSPAGDRRQFNVSLTKLEGNAAGDAAEIWLAITEAGLHSAVTRGENAGEDLHHAPVVRWLRKIGSADRKATPAFSSATDVKLDPGWKPDNLRVIAFVQEKRSRHILGAATTRIER
jgi:hypothetical protein